MKPKKLLRKLRHPLSILNYKFTKYYYLHGNQKKCYICGEKVRDFLPYKNGKTSEFLSYFEVIGTDIKHFSCLKCGSHDRERHLFMFFDKLNLWNSFENKTLLHIAPERKLMEKLSTLNIKIYVKGDLYPTSNDIEKIDLTTIPYPDSFFDFVICNHVLEHISDDIKAMKEIYRVLNKNGLAILQTPYSKVIEHSIENPNFNTPDLRSKYYGEENHVRIYGKDLFKRLEKVGFNL